MKNDGFKTRVAPQETKDGEGRRMEKGDERKGGGLVRQEPVAARGLVSGGDHKPGAVVG